MRACIAPLARITRVGRHPVPHPPPTLATFAIQKLGLIGSTSFNFAQNTINDFQNTESELIMALIVFDKCHKK